MRHADETAPHSPWASARTLLQAAGLLLTALLAVVMLLSAFAVFVLHLAIQPVLSGSMRPTFSPGAAVITRAVPTSSIRAGDIIAFVPPGDSATFTHRVASVSGSPSRPVIMTKGDANPAADPWHAQIIAPSVQKVVGSIPALGRVLVAAEQRGPRLFLVLAARLILCVVGTRSILGSPLDPLESAEGATSVGAMSG